MITIETMVAAILLLSATSAFGSTERSIWPGSSLVVLLGVAIVVFVLIRWKSKP